ncbi:MAG: hypothetical protein NZM31_08040 [Gemmatales bacterium]|nr:hypothetical protein [Gemmatales bacterium]MDW8386943.1 hypothetical protein [Gemmatales bacterium]
MDLVGVTLRLLLRTSQPFLNAYMLSRADDSTVGLSRLHSDIGCILAALGTAQQSQHNTWHSATSSNIATSVREELAKLGLRGLQSSYTHTRVQSPEELAYLLNRGTLVSLPAMIATELRVAYSMSSDQYEFLLREATQAGPGTSPSREDLILYSKLIDEIALLSHTVQCSDSVLRQLKVIDQQLAADSIEGHTAELTTWRNMAIDVLAPVYKYNQGVDYIEQFFQQIYSLAVQYYTCRSGTESHPKVLFRLGDRLLSIINPSHVDACFNQCLSCLQQGETLLKRTKDRCSRAHQSWQRLPPSLRKATGAIVGRMVSRAEAMAEAHRADVQEAEKLIADLKRCYNNVKKVMLDPWKRQIVQRPNASLDTATVPISTVLLDGRYLRMYDPFRIGKIVADLRRINGGAAYLYTAVLLIDEARSLLPRLQKAQL